MRILYIVILVYSIDNKQSFENIGYWYNEACNMLGNNFVLSIVGNKYDLFDSDIIEDTVYLMKMGKKMQKKKMQYLN